MTEKKPQARTKTRKESGVGAGRGLAPLSNACASRAPTAIACYELANFESLASHGPRRAGALCCAQLPPVGRDRPGPSRARAARGRRVGGGLLTLELAPGFTLPAAAQPRARAVALHRAARARACASDWVTRIKWVPALGQLVTASPTRRSRSSTSARAASCAALRSTARRARGVGTRPESSSSRAASRARSSCGTRTRPDRELDGHARPVVDVAVDGDNKRIVSVDSDSTSSAGTAARCAVSSRSSTRRRAAPSTACTLFWDAASATLLGGQLPPVWRPQIDLGGEALAPVSVCCALYNTNFAQVVSGDTARACTSGTRRPASSRSVRARARRARISAMADVDAAAHHGRRRRHGLHVEPQQRPEAQDVPRPNGRGPAGAGAHHPAPRRLGRRGGEAAERDAMPVRKRMQAAAYVAGGVDWPKLFLETDKDGDGGLDLGEFRARCDACSSCRRTSSPKRTSSSSSGTSTPTARARYLQEMLTFVNSNGEQVLVARRREAAAAAVLRPPRPPPRRLPPRSQRASSRTR